MNVGKYPQPLDFYYSENAIVSSCFFQSFKYFNPGLAIYYHTIIATVFENIFFQKQEVRAWPAFLYLYGKPCGHGSPFALLVMSSFGSQCLHSLWIEKADRFNLADFKLPVETYNILHNLQLWASGRSFHLIRL